MDPALPPTDLAALLAGTPYRAPEHLGRGGVADIYAVEHHLLGRRFALKVLHPAHVASPAAAARLRFEARTLGRLQHPNIVRVVDCWSAQGVPCLVLELLEGRTLAEELLERRRLSAAHTTAIARDVLRGLGAAHELGLLHRDLKPENVFLHHEAGFEPVAKLLDFGLARVHPSGSPSAPIAPNDARTATGALVGSGRYMSPEALGRQELDHRADLYAAWLLLYEMLTGEGPYDYDAGPPAPPSAYAPEVSPELDAVVLRGVHRERDLRFQHADEFLGALDGAAPGSGQARPSWRPAPGWTPNCA